MVAGERSAAVLDKAADCLDAERRARPWQQRNGLDKPNN
jgi:hypothetical protein